MFARYLLCAPNTEPNKKKVLNELFYLVIILARERNEVFSSTTIQLAVQNDPTHKKTVQNA